jgi:hypothetical protein
MGFRLVGAAFMPEWSALLTPREHLILLAMCHLALDEERDGCEAGLYFAGHEFLMLRVDGTDHSDDPKAYASARQSIRRALRRLEEVGAIELVREAKNARKAEYRLLVWQPVLPVDNSRSGRAQRAGQGYTHVALRATPM